MIAKNLPKWTTLDISLLDITSFLATLHQPKKSLILDIGYQFSKRNTKDLPVKTRAIVYQKECQSSHAEAVAFWTFPQLQSSQIRHTLKILHLRLGPLHWTYQSAKGKFWSIFWLSTCYRQYSIKFEHFHTIWSFLLCLLCHTLWLWSPSIPSQFLRKS